MIANPIRPATHQRSHSPRLFAVVLIAGCSLALTGCTGLVSGKPSAGGGGTPPPLTIFNTRLSTVMATSATISWQTNLPATSQAEYGTSTNYGSGTALDSTIVTSHQQNLSGLKVSTTYHFRVRSQDANNNVAVSNDMTFSTAADTTPPTVSISAPADGASVSGTVSVTASARDDVSVASVQFQVDGANVGSLDTSSPYFYSWDTTKTNNGAHTLLAIAKDGAGNSATSASVMVTVNNTTPIAAWTLNQTSAPIAVPGMPTDKIDRFPFLVKAGNGKIFLFYDEMPNGDINEYTMAKVSADNGATWSNYTTGTVVQLHIGNIGSGYSSAPAVNVSGGGGLGTVITAGNPVNGAIPSISITAGGSGYQKPTGNDPYGNTLGVTCSITGGGGSGAKCTAIGNVGGVISVVRLTDNGSGYTSTPSCSIGGSGTGATCSVGAPVNGAITSYTITNPGSNFTSAPTLSISGGGGSGATVTPTLTWCLPTDPPGCFHNDYPRQDVNIGGGVTSAGTLFISAVEFGGDSVGTTIGSWFMRSTDNGNTWSNPDFFHASYPVSAYSSATTNIAAIPPGSPGVTGPCAKGCIAKPLRVGNSFLDLLFSYDDGVTWGDEKLIVNQNGYDDETAISWGGGNNLMAFIRPSRDSTANGGRTPLPMVYSSDMGTTWRGTCAVPQMFDASACTGQPNTLTVPPCNPVDSSAETFTNPMSFPAPVGAGLTTLLFGDRFSCTSPVTSNLWIRAVTFNGMNAFNMLTFPTVQYLYNFTNSIGNTTYMYAVPTSGNNVLVVFENGIGGNCNSPLGYACEQIWQMTATYVPTP
jgi:hypothetical protein